MFSVKRTILQKNKKNTNSSLKTIGKTKRIFWNSKKNLKKIFKKILKSGFKNSII